MFNLGQSNLRKKLLGLYFANTDASYYVRELAGMLNVDPTNLSRELRMLERQGLFTVNQRGTQKLYKLNKSFPMFKELKAIVTKTFGAVGILKKAFGKLPGVDLAVLYGSFARGKEDQASDIDVFIVSDTEPEVLYDAIPGLEKQLGREINFTIYSVKEFKKKRRTEDPFLQNIFRNPHEIIRGSL